MLIKLRVHPGSKKNELRKKSEDCFEIWTKAPAERGRANEACLAMLGELLKINPNRIRLIKGGKSPSKIVEVP